jgi:DNA end-binding protein Ku
MPHGDALVLNLMRFPQEIVAADEFRLPAGSPAKYRVSAKELEMGEQLIDSMSTEWNPDDYRDEFRSKLRKIIDAQVARESGKKVKDTEGEAPRSSTPGNVFDFTALLKKGASPESLRPGARRRPLPGTGRQAEI